MTFTDPANPLREVDVLVAPSLDPDGIAARAVERSAGTTPVRVATIEDLVRMKRIANRPQDLADITSRTHLASNAVTRDDDGFTYEVSDETLRRFATSTIAQRLEWLDEMRTFSWAMATRETRERWRRAREFGHQLA